MPINRNELTDPPVLKDNTGVTVFYESFSVYHKKLYIVKLSLKSIALHKMEMRRHSIRW